MDNWTGEHDPDVNETNFLELLEDHKICYFPYDSWKPVMNIAVGCIIKLGLHESYRPFSIRQALNVFNTFPAGISISVLDKLGLLNWEKGSSECVLINGSIFRKFPEWNKWLKEKVTRDLHITTDTNTLNENLPSLITAACSQLNMSHSDCITFETLSEGMRRLGVTKTYELEEGIRRCECEEDEWPLYVHFNCGCIIPVSAY